MSIPPTVLIVDDDPVNRIVLQHQVAHLGYRWLAVDDGAEALAALKTMAVDLVLLDVLMPRIDGFGVLQAMKADPQLFWIPVIIISTLDTPEVIARAIELGADDHMVKPWSIPLLKARLRATLIRKEAHDREQAAREELRQAQERTSKLLHQIFPAPIVQRLLRGEQDIADVLPDATVLFADLVSFTDLSERLPGEQIVALLNNIFSTFDSLAEHYGVETIKTQGDAYIAAAGVPYPVANHTETALELALMMQASLADIRERTGLPLHMRIGLDSGAVVAGAIGVRKISYDLWGDTVNLASRMESHGITDQIQVTEAIYQQARNSFAFVPRGPVEIKGKGVMQTYFLLGPLLSSAAPQPTPELAGATSNR